MDGAATIGGEGATGPANPVAQRHWDYSESTTIIRRLFSERMFPITIEGLEGAMKELVR